MSRGRQPSLYLQFLLLVFAGSVNRRLQAVIDYLHAENQSLREQLGNQWIRWTDAQRRRLAETGKAVGQSALAALGTVVTPDTLLRWYRNLVAAKYDGSLFNLGHDIARNTVKAILKERGIDPAPHSPEVASVNSQWHESTTHTCSWRAVD